MRNTEKARPAYFVLSITETGDTKCLLTTRYTDPLFIARRCSIAAADKVVGSMMHKAFPEATVVEQSPELFSTCSIAIDFDRGVFSVMQVEPLAALHNREYACSIAIDFDRGVFSVMECGQWFDLPLQAAVTAADWCYERLGNIPLEQRTLMFYLCVSAER